MLGERNKRAKKPYKGMPPLPEIPNELFIEEVDSLNHATHLNKVHADHVALWRFMRDILNDSLKKIGFIAES